MKRIIAIALLAISTAANAAILVRAVGVGNGMWSCEYSNGVVLVVQGRCPSYIPD